MNLLKSGIRLKPLMQTDASRFFRSKSAKKRYFTQCRAGRPGGDHGKATRRQRERIYRSTL